MQGDFREMLKELPEDVAELWLAPQVEAHGWPFRRVTDSAEGSRWHGLLGYQSLVFWEQATWERKQLAYAHGVLHPESKKHVTDIFMAHGLGIDTGGAAGKLGGGPARFSKSLEFIRRERRLPRPLILLETEEGLFVLDGHHRLAAVHGEYLQSGRGLGWELDVWVAHGLTGEVFS